MEGGRERGGGENSRERVSSGRDAAAVFQQRTEKQRNMLTLSNPDEDVPSTACIFRFRSLPNGASLSPPPSI